MSDIDKHSKNKSKEILSLVFLYIGLFLFSTCTTYYIIYFNDKHETQKTVEEIKSLILDDTDDKIYRPYNKEDTTSKNEEPKDDSINENIDDDSIICFFKPRVLYLNTNVYSYTKEDDAAALKEADYVLLWCNDFWSSIRASIEKDGTYELIYQNNQFFLYKCP